jgi:hypothetical protein
MKFKGFLCHVSFLWVDGIALFPFILVKRKSPGRLLLNHECIHLRQQLEMGLVFFYVWCRVSHSFNTAPCALFGIHEYFIRTRSVQQRGRLRLSYKKKVVGVFGVCLKVVVRGS